jgi:uncharacterized membrane protein YkvA (DUF1232 family)
MRTSHPDQVQARTFWRKVSSVAGRVPFTTEVVAAYFAMRDPHTPWRHKAVLAGAIAYFILPLDAIPDVILPIGYTDDAAALVAAIGAARMSITDDHRARARQVLGLLGEGPPGRGAPGVVPGEVVGT